MLIRIVRNENSQARRLGSYLLQSLWRNSWTSGPLGAPPWHQLGVRVIWHGGGVHVPRITTCDPANSRQLQFNFSFSIQSDVVAIIFTSFQHDSIVCSCSLFTLFASRKTSHYQMVLEHSYREFESFSRLNTYSDVSMWRCSSRRSRGLWRKSTRYSFSSKFG